MPSPETVRARELRRDMSNTERRVWFRLRRRSVGGHKFRPQVPIGPHFADFACVKARLVIEIDSEFHEDPARDQRKTDYLEARGWRVLRVFASQTDRDLGDLIEMIGVTLEECSSPP